ncbi:MAG TPA: M20/M25/M40 family metallo-hydrolase [Sphingomicrobium sp.]|jgi:hypothetical protein
MRRDTLLALGVVVLILAALAAKSILISVPPLHDGAGQFDANRAKARLANLLGDERPHPADSEGDDMVRSSLVATLQGMGLNPIVRDQFACNGFQKAQFVACARVRNVIAVLGPATGRALLLSAHYDSVPVGPGASDDGAGVATLLEVGSILKDRPLKRTVILLFNEGEEFGLIGARAFLADPLSRHVDSVLNFEARGVTGPVTMFETSRPNAAAIEALARSVRRPFASSLSTDVYHLLPNDTDVTTYSERGWLALNFAMAGNETHYHSPGDDLASLDPRSLQHMGDQALAVAAELASGVPQVSGQRIFMDIAGRLFVQMPLAIGLIIFALLIGCFAFLVWKRRAYGRALAAPVAGLVLGTAGGWLSGRIMGILEHGLYWRAHPEISFAAIYATVIVAALAIFRTLGAPSTRDQLRAASWFVFLLVGALLATVAPGVIIYFLVPPLIAAIGIAAARWNRSAEAIGGLIAIVVLFVTWGELLALLEVLFSPGPLWIVAPVAAIMIIPVLVEAQPLFARASRRFVLIGSASIALLAWAVAAAAPAYSADRQQRFTIEHVTELPSRRSYWSVLNDGARLPKAYERVAQWREGKLPFADRTRALAPAPALTGIQAPALEPVEIVRHGNERTMRLRLRANGSERIFIIAPEDAHIRSGGVSGFVRPIGTGDSGAKFTLSCAGRSCDGAELLLDQAGGGPTVFTLVGARNGLPQSAASLIAARPQFARPQYTPDETVVFTRVKL